MGCPVALGSLGEVVKLGNVGKVGKLGKVSKVSKVGEVSKAGKAAKLSKLRSSYIHIWGTQTGSYQTVSYQKGRFIPPKPNILYVDLFDTATFILLLHTYVGSPGC